MMMITILLCIIASWTIALCLKPCPNERLPNQCDFIVVGTGASGAVLAARLSENPRVVVCLFEAGIKHTDGKFASAVSIPRAHGATGPAGISWNTTTITQIGLNNRIISNGMGKVLGGSTTHNGMVYSRGFKADYDFWAENGAPGWDYESIFPFFIKAENQTSPYLRNSRLCVIQKTIRNGRRHSTANAYLEPALGRRNLFVVTEALVGKILVSASTKKAYGIRYLKHGQIHTIRSTKEVIVSGGTWETAKLLQLSGIGPKSVLQRLKVRPHMKLPVGQFIQDHGVISLDLEVNIEGLMPEGRLWSDGFLPIKASIDFLKQKHNWPEIQTVVFYGRIEEILGDSDIVLGIQGNPPFLNNDARPNGTSIGIGPLHPRSRGRVMAKTTDPMDNPLIDPRYLTNRADVIDVIKGIRYLQKIVSESPSMRKVKAKLRPSFVESLSDCFNENKFDSDGFWECALRRQMVTIHHPVGSCQMGPRKRKWAVVDTKLRVYGIRGLRVADASVMPEIISGNTMAPAIMIGERAADIIKRDHLKMY